MSWSLRNWFARLTHRGGEERGRPKDKRKVIRPAARLQIEALEDRTLLSSWTLLPTNVPNYPNVNLGPMIQLSDGSVMVQKGGTSSQWFKLTPDASGNYVNGSWSALASMHVARQYYGSNVLPSG